MAAFQDWVRPLRRLGNAVHVVVEFVEVVEPPSKNGENVWRRLETRGSSYLSYPPHFSYQGEILVHPLRGAGIALGNAAFTVVAAHASGFCLRLPCAEVERREFAGLFSTRDQKAGMQSFVENGPGKASFEGR